MSEKQTEILHMRVTPDTVIMLDDLRKAEKDLPSRTEMVRRLISRSSQAKTRTGGARGTEDQC